MKYFGAGALPYLLQVDSLRENNSPVILLEYPVPRVYNGTRIV